MSSEGGISKRQDDKEMVTADSFDGDMSKIKIDSFQKKRTIQNNVRCQRYRSKKKNEAINSKNSKHQIITVEEQEKLKRRQEKNKQNSRRYRDKKRTISLVNLQTNENTVVKHDPNFQNSYNSQIAGPSIKNVPYISPTHTASLSIKSEPYSSELYPNYNDKIHNDTPSQANFVPQVQKSINNNNAPNTQNIQPLDSFDSVLSNHTTSLSIKNELFNQDSHSDYSHVIHNNTLSQVNFVLQAHEPIKKNNTPNTENIQPHHSSDVVRPIATAILSIKNEPCSPEPYLDHHEKIIHNDIPTQSHFIPQVHEPNKQNYISNTENIQSQHYFHGVPQTDATILSIKSEPHNLEPYSVHNDKIHNKITRKANFIPQVHELNQKKNTLNTENIESGNSFDIDVSKNKIDTVQQKKKIQNKIRCQRYRAKKKNEAINSKKSNTQTLTIEEQEKIKRRKEQNSQNSRRYRDKKRTINLINLQTNQNTIVKHPNCQNSNKSQIAGPSTKNVPYVPQTNTASLLKKNALYDPESHSDYNDEIDSDTPSQANALPHMHESIKINITPNADNIQLNEVQNNTQEMHSQCNLPVQTYSSFQKNSSAHREFQKDFWDNDFGHACEICDRLWFKKDLKNIVNNDATPNIQFIRTLLTNVNVTEVKVCSSCLPTIKKKCVPPLSVYNGFKYPPFPDELKNVPLDFVTERLISPRIPFMKIHNQFGIYGQVINVPIELNTMVHSLPRNDDHSIAVHIRNRKIHKSSYIYGIVINGKIKVWLRYLIGTPLYTFYDIKVDDSFLNGQDDSKYEFVYNQDGDSDISELIPIDESLAAQQQTLMWNDDIYLRIVSEEDNVSFNLLFDELAEELSFPQIYLGQFRTFREGLGVTPYMMATSEIRRSDRRGVAPQHLLYLALKIMRIRIRDSLPIAFKHVSKSTTTTKAQTEVENDMEECIESNLTSLRTIPNSVYYWSARKKDLFAMIRQYGKPTIFFTISANETGWPKLLQLLYKLKNNSEISVEDATALHLLEKCTLINEDAITCAIYFNRLVNVLLKILQSKRFSPFKKYRILYYFKRIEFKNRSTQAHIIAWLGNAPEDALGKDYNQAIELIDFLISVSGTEASGNIKLQTHKHTFTCYEGLVSRSMQKCIFEAPFMPIKKTMILKPMNDTEDGCKEYKAKYNTLRKKLKNNEYDDFQTLYQDNNINSDEEYCNIIRAGINRPRVFPKRQPHEKWCNPFNPFILNIVKSNIDFHFLTDEYACAAYIVDYVLKTNRSVSNLQRQIIETMNEHPEFYVLDITKNISIDLLNHIEITSQEAAWYLLKEPISKSSTIITYIPTLWPVERQRIKKTTKELSELDEYCTDIWKENWFDLYQKRPEGLENISLAQFVSQYFKNKKGEYVKRDEPRVIRYRNYDMSDYIEYKREMVTLHIPFRHEEGEILEENKFIKLYDDNVDLISQKRKEFESNIDIKRMLQICRE